MAFGPGSFFLGLGMRLFFFVAFGSTQSQC